MKNFLNQWRNIFGSDFALVRGFSISASPCTTKTENFSQWFVGFAEGEGCFKIKPRYRGDKVRVHSFSFEFEIHLHIDEKPLLDKVCASLGIGKVYSLAFPLALP